MFEKWSSFRLALIPAFISLCISMALVFYSPAPLPIFLVVLFLVGAFFVPLVWFWWLIDAFRQTITGKPEKRTFGSPGRIQEYTILLRVGLGVLIAGGILFLFGENWMIGGIALLFIGLMCAISGCLGLGEERKKYGMKQKSTTAGIGALIFGILSVFLSSGPYISIILGIFAITLAIKAVKDGDNEYGLAGGICGTIGLIVNLYVMSLFTFLI